MIYSFDLRDRRKVHWRGTERHVQPKLRLLLGRRETNPRGVNREGQSLRVRTNRSSRYLAGALVAGALVVAGGDDIFSSDLLQPAKSTRSGTSIRIFFMCFIL